jgi:hypothetical protein
VLPVRLHSPRELLTVCMKGRGDVWGGVLGEEGMLRAGGGKRGGAEGGARDVCNSLAVRASVRAFVCVYIYVCACVCVSVSERERERGQ